MRELGADYGIHGEGEEPLAELIGTLERGRTEIDIPSVYTRDGRRGSRPQELPAFDRGAVRARIDGLLLEAERDAQHTDQAGCPYDCIYCSYPSIDRAVRADDGSRGHRRKYPAR